MKHFAISNLNEALNDRRTLEQSEISTLSESLHDGQTSTLRLGKVDFGHACYYSYFLEVTYWDVGGSLGSNGSQAWLRASQIHLQWEGETPAHFPTALPGAYKWPTDETRGIKMAYNCYS